MDATALALAGVVAVMGGSTAWALKISNRAQLPITYKATIPTEIPYGLKTAATLICQFYDGLGLTVRVVGATAGFQVNSFKCSVPARLNTSKMKMTCRDLEHFLQSHGLKITSGSLKIDIAGEMTITYGKKAAKNVYLSSVYRHIDYNMSTTATFPIGFCVDGTAFSIPIDKQASPHVMIVGSTGSGKTVVGMCIIVGALQKGWDVVILNPKQPPAEKRLGLWDFIGFDGVTYASSYNEMIDVINRVVLSMERLERPTLVIADELADIIDTMKGEISDPLGTIAQKGREYDLHFVGMTPKTTKSVLLSDMLHANAATTLIGLRTLSKYLSMYGTGLGGMDLEKLAGNGHARVRIGSEITEVQCAIPDNLEAVRRTKSRPTIDTGDSLLPITAEWFERVEVGGSVSKNALRQYASGRGRGIGYRDVVQQYGLLERQGRVTTTGHNRAGVKVR